MTRTNRTYATVQVRRDSPAFLAAQKAATGKRGESVNAILRRGLDHYHELRRFVADATAALEEGFRTDNYVPVREILNSNGIYADDLSDMQCHLRLVQLVGQRVK